MKDRMMESIETISNKVHNVVRMNWIRKNEIVDGYSYLQLLEMHKDTTIQESNPRVLIRESKGTYTLDTSTEYDNLVDALAAASKYMTGKTKGTTHNIETNEGTYKVD